MVTKIGEGDDEIATRVCIPLPTKKETRACSRAEAVPARVTIIGISTNV
jgi:hypothetical protein